MKNSPEIRWWVVKRRKRAEQGEVLAIAPDGPQNRVRGASVAVFAPHMAAVRLIGCRIFSQLREDRAGRRGRCIAKMSRVLALRRDGRAVARRSIPDWQRRQAAR